MPGTTSIVLLNTGPGKGKASAAFGVMGRRWAQGIEAKKGHRVLTVAP